MRPILLDLDPANVNLIGYASNVTGATWALTANDSGDSLAHTVTIRNDSATDYSTLTALLTGTDADGYPQTETVALPVGSATTEGVKYFLTLTSIVPSATINTDTMDIGWANKFSSKTICLDWYRDNAPTVSISVTGVINLDVMSTNNNPLTKGKTVGIPEANQIGDQETYTWIDDTVLAAVTADAHASISLWPSKAIRLIANSYTDTAEAQVEVTQSY
jgi:hypothetical protein